MTTRPRGKKRLDLQQAEVQQQPRQQPERPSDQPKPLPNQPWIKEAFARRLDAACATRLVPVVGKLPPQQLLLAWLDWASHLALAPGKQAQLLELGLRECGGLLKSALRKGEAPEDRRYGAASWKRRPFSVLARSASASRKLWDAATTDVPGLNRGNAALLHFQGTQLLEALAPDHWPLTNPEVLQATWQSRGRNLAGGARNLLGDAWRQARGKPLESEEYKVGQNLAATPGQVILRNRLMELIQYTPTTPRVHAEPVLIVPAWIMKYYILDLQQKNSLVAWLVSQGFTVFMISWKNPDAKDRDLCMDDYRKLGVLAALDAIRAVLPRSKVHAVGYCVGGTLLTIAAAAMARDGDDRLATTTLFAAQTDFTEAGDLKLFINESTLHWLDAQMAKSGFLTAGQMAGTFGARRAHDLVWSPLLRRYWLGERDRGASTSWPGTRMPRACRSRMHSLIICGSSICTTIWPRGRYQVDGQAISVGRYRALPMFVMSRHRHRSCRALAIGLQDPQAQADGRHHLRPDQRRTQRRHRFRAGPPAPRLPHRQLERADPLQRARTVGGPGRRVTKGPGGRPGASGWRGNAARTCQRRRRWAHRTAAGFAPLCDAPGQLHPSTLIDPHRSPSHGRSSHRRRAAYCGRPFWRQPR